jgi:hypothetical protein
LIFEHNGVAHDPSLSHEIISKFFEIAKVIILQTLQFGRIIGDGDGNHRRQRWLRKAGTWNLAVHLRNRRYNLSVLDVGLRAYFDGALHLRVRSREACRDLSCRLELDVAIASDLHRHIGGGASRTNDHVDVVLLHVEHRGQLSFHHSLCVNREVHFEVKLNFEGSFYIFCDRECLDTASSRAIIFIGRESMSKSIRVLFHQTTFAGEEQRKEAVVNCTGGHVTGVRTSKTRMCFDLEIFGAQTKHFSQGGKELSRIESRSDREVDCELKSGNTSQCARMCVARLLLF